MTERLFEIDPYIQGFEAIVTECLEKKGRYHIALNRSAFFPEGGGQPGDRGWINDIPVLDTHEKDGIIWHYTEKPLEAGQSVRGKLDWSLRFSNMQNHAGEHIISGIIHRRFGYDNVGFHMGSDAITLDINGELTVDQVRLVENEANQAIEANLPIVIRIPEKNVLDTMSYRSKKEIDGAVRIVEIPGYDICACCAPHVKRTGEIGMFKIQSVQNYKGGMRISFLCGFRALEEYRRKAEIVTEVSGLLTTNQENIADHVSKLKTQVQSLKNQIANVKQNMMESKMREIPAEQKDVILFEQDLDTPVMRNVVNKLMENHDGVCGIFVGTDEDGYNFIIGSKTVDCRDLANTLKEKFDARGGGKPQMIQGSLVAKADAIICSIL